MARRSRLKLIRREQETVIIRCPDGREIFVTNLGPSTSKLLVEAPEDVAVWRAEIDPKRNNTPATQADTVRIPMASLVRYEPVDSENGEPD